MIDDIADGAKWLVSSNYADKDKLFIMGISYGGYAALMSTIRYPELYRAAVSQAAPLDLIDQIKDYKKNKNHFAYEFWNVAVGDVRREKSDLKKISPYYQIDNMKVPYRIFHGREDPIVSVDQVEKFNEKLGSKKSTVKILKDEGHGFDIQSNEIYYAQESLKFFNEVIGAEK